jgi:hypothetical protein
VSEHRVRAEPALGEPAAGEPAAAPPGPAAYEAVRQIAHTAGNRAAGLLLARHTADAVDVTKARTTDRNDPRFAKVDADLSFSKYGWEAMGIMDKYKVRLVLTDEGAPASFLPDFNRCIINLTRPSYEVAAYFVHEMHHAVQFHEGRSPAATTMGSDDWVRMMVKEEIDGTQKGFLHKLALERFGRAPEDDRPQGMNYFRGAFTHGKKKALEQGLEGVAAGDAARANAYRMTEYLIADPTGKKQTTLGPNQFDSYERYYRREWARLNKPKP